MEIKNVFIHHVFFWLKEKDEKKLAQLVAALKKLAALDLIKQYHIGVPADTNRSVVENTYSVSWLVFFDNKEDEEAYQIHPTHLDFVKENSELWNRVVVHDTIDTL